VTTLDDALRDAVAAGLEPLARRIDQLANPSDRPLAVTAEKAAELLSVGDDLIRRWVADGLLPRVPHSRLLRIPYSALEAFVEASTSATPPPASTRPLRAHRRPGDGIGAAESTTTSVIPTDTARRGTRPAASVVPLPGPSGRRTG
jgi:excisionase family DNA binding protein